jgi:hypothetical protein
MTDMLRVLAVGSKESRDLVRDALLFRRRSHLLVASNYWELCSLWDGEAQQVSVAVIDLCTSDRELRRANGGTHPAEMAGRADSPSGP